MGDYASVQTNTSPYHVYPAQFPVQAAFHTPTDGSPIAQNRLLLTPDPSEIEQAVNRIHAMFPTATDTHIRILLKKYYNREAVVISALQVEKHPISEPGPLIFRTPPARWRHLTGANIAVNALQMTPIMGRDASSKTGSPMLSGRMSTPITRASSGNSTTLYGSPIGYRSSPRPHSSPKMKLRYLKSVFPKADETFLLDVLAGSDNNVQGASLKLLSLGYEKHVAFSPLIMTEDKKKCNIKDNKKKENSKTSKSAKSTPNKKTSEEEEETKYSEPSDKIARSREDKIKMQLQMQSQYAQVSNELVRLALDSANYSEQQAKRFLDSVLVDKRQPGETKVKINDLDSDNKQSNLISSDIANQTASSKSEENINDLNNIDKNKSEDTEKTVEGSVGIYEESSYSKYDSKKNKSSKHNNSVGDKRNKNNVNGGDSITGLHWKTSKNENTLSKQDNGSTPEDSDQSSSKENSWDKITAALKIKDRLHLKTFTRESSRQQLRTQAKGPDSTLCKGPDNDLLLLDYQAWCGPDPALRKGPSKALLTSYQNTKNVLLNSNNKTNNSTVCPTTNVNLSASNKSKNTLNAKGPNPLLRKGPDKNILLLSGTPNVSKKSFGL